jgi:hypothetical protein
MAIVFYWAIASLPSPVLAGDNGWPIILLDIIFL